MVHLVELAQAVLGRSRFTRRPFRVGLAKRRACGSQRGSIDLLDGQILGRQSPGGKEAQGIVRGRAGLSCVNKDPLSGIVCDFERFVCKGELADNWVVQRLCAGVV